MEEGALRCDANVSVRPTRAEGVRRKVEIKNMNSFRAVERALAYEAERQEAELRAGHTIEQQTRGWREDKGVTVAQRSKEERERLPLLPGAGPAAAGRQPGMGRADSRAAARAARRQTRSASSRRMAFQTTTPTN